MLTAMIIHKVLVVIFCILIFRIGWISLSKKTESVSEQTPLNHVIVVVLNKSMGAMLVSASLIAFACLV